MLNPSRNGKRNTRSVKSIQTWLTKRTLQKSSRSTRNTITGVPWDGHARERVQPASGPVMADDCPLLQQRSKHGPESGPHGFRCADSPRSTRMRLLVLSSLGCERSVCVRPFGPRGFRRNRSKRHANHSFQNRWPNDRFGEKKALVERGRLTEVDGRFLIKWFSMRSMLRENWLVLASLSAFGDDCRDFFRISYSTMSLVVINVCYRGESFDRGWSVC